MPKLFIRNEFFWHYWSKFTQNQMTPKIPGLIHFHLATCRTLYIKTERLKKKLEARLFKSNHNCHKNPERVQMCTEGPFKHLRLNFFALSTVSQRSRFWELPHISIFY